jgi:hypothetical protein
MRRPERKHVVLAGALVALACVTSASAARAGHWKVAFTKAGQKAANAAVLHQSDLGAVWKGSGATPNLAAPRCASAWGSKSPLIATGAAKIDWSDGNHVSIKSQAVVLQTAKMVSIDWKRTIVAPKILACTKKTLARTLPKGERLVALSWQRFPRLTKYTREVRAILSVKGAAAVVDFLAIGAGKDEITLTFVQPGLGDGIAKIEAIWAKKLLARIS